MVFDEKKKEKTEKKKKKQMVLLTVLLELILTNDLHGLFHESYRLAGIGLFDFVDATELQNKDCQIKTRREKVMNR